MRETGIAACILNFGTKGGECSAACPGRFTCRINTSITPAEESGWTLEPVWILSDGHKLLPLPAIVHRPSGY